MLLHEFPNLNWLKAKIDQRFEDGIGWNGTRLDEKGWPTILLNAKAKNTVRDQIKGPLSIFTNLKGSSFVGTSNKRVKVSEDTFFITNTDQLYTLEILEPVETFNIHIGEKLSEEVFYATIHNTNYLLDNPESQVSSTPIFHNRLYWKDHGIKSLMHQLSKVSSKIEEKELLTTLINTLMIQNNIHKNNELSLNVVNANTRKEISKRLSLATDFIYSYYQKEISLEQLAHVSCLSKFHFLRLFKSTFNETPHQFITNLRIEKAKDYLKSNSSTVKDIAAKVGFADASSFSRSFKNKVGRYPLQFIA